MCSSDLGHDTELAHYMDLSSLGAVVVKSLYHEPWAGNPAPRVHVAGAGMINAVGLEGPGVLGWCNDSLPRLEKAGATTVVSIWGRSVEDYVAYVSKGAGKVTETLVEVSQGEPRDGKPTYKYKLTWAKKGQTLSIPDTF